MISQSAITKTAPWKSCVIRTRIYYDNKGRRESLTRNHNQALFEANRNWHITTLPERNGPNPLRQYYDEGMRVTNSKNAVGFRFNNVASFVKISLGCRSALSNANS